VGDLLSAAQSVRASYLYLAKYGYTGDVLENNNFLRVFPYADDFQTPDIVQFLTIPSGRDVTFFDGFDNEVRRALIEAPHQQLVIAASGSVRLYPRTEPPPDLPLGEALSATFLRPEFLSPSPLITPPQVASVARDIIAGQETLLGSTQAIVEWVHANVEYKRGVTHVGTTATEVLNMRQGVCQDVTHLTLALMRAAWIPCRYVSGLLTEEVGETHAWVEFWHPEAGWIACDPTRGKPLVTGPDHVKFAVGRDYTDVPPVIGEYRGTGSGYLDRVVAEARLETNTRPLEEAIAALAGTGP
jgi:transglutaminase-like putative cysteine protease